MGEPLLKAEAARVDYRQMTLAGRWAAQEAAGYAGLHYRMVRKVGGRQNNSQRISRRAGKRKVVWQQSVKRPMAVGFGCAEVCIMVTPPRQPRMISTVVAGVLLFFGSVRMLVMPVRMGNTMCKPRHLLCQ